MILELFQPLTLYFPMFPFDPPENIRNQRFSDVFRRIKREHWEVKSYLKGSADSFNILQVAHGDNLSM